MDGPAWDEAEGGGKERVVAMSRSRRDLWAVVVVCCVSGKERREREREMG